MKRCLLIAASLFAASMAHAADEPRKIDFTTTIPTIEGAVMQECADDPLPKEDRECKQHRPVTLGKVVSRALANPEPNLALDESVRRGVLAKTLYQSAGAALTADEIALIKKQLPKLYGPYIVYVAVEILDPASIKKN